MHKRDILIGLALALLVAFGLSPFASRAPDGLERVAGEKWFLNKQEGRPAIQSPVADYAWPNIKNKKRATSVAAITGTLIVFGASLCLAVFLKKKESS